MSQVIGTERLGVEIAGRPILREVSLEIHPGEVVALLGENGSGKSTLVRSMLGLQPHRNGGVRLFDTPLHEFHEWARVGYVPQHSDTIATGVPASVAEVVASGRLARRRPFRPASRADRAASRDALDAVGLRDRSRDSLHTLSGGQRQRVLIARALAGQPELLILDEPNAGVDAGSQQALAATLSTLVETGSTLVVVLHELGPLASLITRVVRLAQGRVVYDGHPTEDVGNGHVHHLPQGGFATVLRAPLEDGH